MLRFRSRTGVTANAGSSARPLARPRGAFVSCASGVYPAIRTPIESCDPGRGEYVSLYEGGVGIVVRVFPETFRSASVMRRSTSVT